MRENDKSRGFFPLFDFDTSLDELITMMATGIHVTLGITEIY